MKSGRIALRGGGGLLGVGGGAGDEEIGFWKQTHEGNGDFSLLHYTLFSLRRTFITPDSEPMRLGPNHNKKDQYYLSQNEQEKKKTLGWG